MPTLVVVRHAKADHPGDVDDIARPLLRRGRDDARAAGAWLQQTLGRPGLIVSSPARRTAETVEGILTAYGEDTPPVVYEERMYEASLGDLLRVVRGLDPDAPTVVLVGHNPSVSDLVSDLTGASGDLPTCGIAVIRVPSPWADTPSRECDLVALEKPRA